MTAADFSFSDLLEGGNGMWAILAFWLTCFMAFHIGKVRAQRNIEWWRFVFNFSLPQSMQLAVGTLVVATAIFLTRLALWAARHKHQQDVLLPESILYASGTVLGIIGFLCILRTVSQPTFGHWPWICALVSSFAYLGWWSFQNFA